MTVRQKDKKQRMILEELLKDGTQSYATIANTLGMHHNTVKKYITEYERTGIILGYSADLAYETISDMYLVLFRCSPFTQKDYELLRERLDKGLLETKEPKVLDSYFTVGEFQAAVIIMTENVFALHRYLNYLINSYDYLNSYVVLQVSRTNQRNLHPNKDWDTLENLVNFEEHQIDR